MDSLYKKSQKHMPLNKPTAMTSKNKYLIYAGIGWLVYLLLFFSLKHFIKPQYYIHSTIDDHIPFIKWFFLPYCFWYFYMGLALLYFNRTSISDFKKLQSYIFIGFGMCLIIYVLFPNAIDFRPDIVKTDLITIIMADMYSIDSSTMVIPSMHVFGSIAVHVSLVKNSNTKTYKPLIIASFIIMVLICASTVLVKQHSIIDVFFGALLAIVLYFPIYNYKINHAILKLLHIKIHKY